MADFTIYLSDLVASGYDVEGKALQDYPAPSESVRKQLNAMIINHYADREIGSESPDLFCFRLRRAMSEIMPYYCDTYIANAKLAGFDPTKTYGETVETIRRSEGESHDVMADKNTDDYTATGTTSGNASGTSKGTTNSTGSNTSDSNGSGTNKSKQYDVPITGSNNGFNDTYATSGNNSDTSDTNHAESQSTDKTENSSESSSTSSTTSNNTNKGTHESSGKRDRTETASGTDNSTRSGYNMAVWQAVEQYRNTVENWLLKVVTNSKVDNCFLQVFNGYCDVYGCGCGFGWGW